MESTKHIATFTSHPLISQCLPGGLLHLANIQPPHVTGYVRVESKPGIPWNSD